MDGNEATARIAYAMSDVSFIYPVSEVHSAAVLNLWLQQSAWLCRSSPCTRHASQLRVLILCAMASLPELHSCLLQLSHLHLNDPCARRSRLQRPWASCATSGLPTARGTHLVTS